MLAFMLLTASRVREYAANSAAAGHEYSAGEVYPCSANYYIAALHRHPDPAAADVPILTRHARNAFMKAIRGL